MSDSDNDKSAAIDKVVGAFRARREQAKDAPAPAETTESTESTPVVQLGEGDAPLTPKGGDSESPTKVFAVPAEVAKAAAAATGGALVEETVVGEPLSAEQSESGDADEAEPATEQAAVVEESVDLVSGDDAETVEVEADDAASDADDDRDDEETAADESATTRIEVPAEVAAAAAAATAQTTKITAPQPAAPTVDTAKPAPGPQVIPPATPTAERKSGGKLVGALVAVVVVVAAIAVGAWFLLNGSSAEDEVADVATSYENAMAEGDLTTLREITCGADNEYYTTISDEDFAEAYQAQRAADQIKTFDEVTAVQIDGDVAQVGVDMYNPSNDTSRVPARITLHRVDGAWKVCTSLD